jgi:hypothetical protein
MVEPNPKFRVERELWKLDQALQLEELRCAEAAGFELGEARGFEIGKAERDMEIALNAFKSVPAGKSLTRAAKILGTFGLAEAVVNSARSQVEAGRG